MKLTAQPLIRFVLLLAVCMLSFLAAAAQANQVKGVRIWPSPDSTRIVVDLANKPNYQVHYLKEPDRLLIDLQSTVSQVALSKIKNTGPLVKKLRESASDHKGTYRIAIDLNKASKARVFTLSPEKPYGHRLVLDLPHNSATVAAAVAPPVINKTTHLPTGRDIIVAIDAGHGGEDPGALGKYTYEKNVTLQIAKRLQKRINKQKGMSAFLVRTGDYFINLNKRSAIARKKKADFLVSIHADGFTSSQPRGASVWVLSNRRATSELGRWMEKHEAHSELLGGAGDLIQDSSSVPFLTEMFLDMSMGNAMDVGYHAGDLVVNELKKVTKLHKSRPVHASLAVLKSPDIPSILVEAGFITNRTEEKLLNQAEHQNKIANAVFTGIYKHFLDAPPQDTLFAQKKRAIKHTVRSGESLSILATRYSVSIGDLRSYNNLHSSVLKIGQVIKIPPNYQLVIKADEIVASVPQPAKEVVHRVQRGESLSLIAQRYGKSLQQLKTYNNLRSTSLAIGQKINIPGQTVAAAPQPPVAVAPQPVQVVVHKVQRGESLSLIAQRYGKTTSQLKAYNKLRSTVLAVGQKIKVPGQPVTAVQVVVHKVQRGESLSVIANRYGKSTSELKDYNKLRSTSLRIGQQLKIPDQPVDSIALLSTQAQVAPLLPVLHRVKSGESLSVIASRYGKTTSELKNYNNLRSTALRVGQQLKIPSLAAAAETIARVEPAAPVLQTLTHRVKPGESLSVIASRYGKSTSELKAFNKLRSTSLQVGQRLSIPDQPVTSDTLVSIAKKAQPLQPQVHRVKSGESLSVIASRYGKTTSELKAYNKLRSTSLRIGQQLKIPGQGAAPETVAQAKPVTKKLQTIIHRVKSGESLSVIASRYGQSTSELKAYNKLRSTSLRVGQQLKIPEQPVETVVLASVATQRAPLSPLVHRVKSGESLSVIASRYGKTTSELKNYNKLRSTTLSVGQQLNIPGATNASAAIASVEPESALAKTVIHRVKSGESLSLIAKRYGKSINQLKALNRLDSTVLAVGQKLLIQGKVNTVATKVATHRVKPGESLSLIAQRYGKTVKQLQAYNKLRSTAIQVGQKIKIPSADYQLPVQPVTVTYQVKRGESLSVIANRFATTAQALKNYNKLRSSALQVGQKIIIPTSFAQLTKHKVRSGESLSVIANRYGTTTHVLKAFNKLRSSSLAIGQVLTVPIT